MAVAIFIISAGWFFSVTISAIFAAFLDLLFVIDVKVNPRTKARIAAHSIILAEYLGEATQEETGE